jgi:hypothetical protein
VEKHVTPTVRTGGCLCGAIRYAVSGPLRPVIICHCVFCRRTTTRGGAYTACARDDLTVAPSRALKWYRSSPTARRGFCGTCGSQLFWEPTGRDTISVSAGSLDSTEGLRLGEQVFLDQRPDFER